MNKRGNLFSIFLLGLTASCGGGANNTNTTNEPPKIFTSGQAERRVAPNMAKITLAVLTRATNADKAREDNAAKTTALMAKFKELKISEDEVQTLDYHIQEIVNYDKGSSKIDGYEVVNRMQLKVLDVKSVGKLIDQLVPLGVNKIEAVEFDVAEKEEIYRELLEEATTLAREKASRMASAAGLGKITVLEAREEVGYNPGPLYKGFAMNPAAREDNATQLAPTAVLKANVTITAKAKE